MLTLRSEGVTVAVRSRPGSHRITLVEQGKIKLEPLISAEYPLENINDVFDVLRKGDAVRSNVVP